VELNAAGKLEEAAEALKQGLIEQPDHAKAWWLLGGIYWQLGRYTEALPFRRRAVELKPRNERCSLGLFHTLLDAGLAEETIAEVRRFLREVERGAKCSEETRLLYDDYDTNGISSLVKAGDAGLRCGRQHVSRQLHAW
jgi:cytochrome c-type biogenesis protein CcmH/NrfG